LYNIYSGPLLSSFYIHQSYKLFYHTFHQARSFNKKKATEDESEYEQLSSILGATPPTGMRTFTDDGERIWDNSMAMEMAYQSGEESPGASSHKPQGIGVAHHISTTSNILDGAERSRDGNLLSN